MLALVLFSLAATPSPAFVAQFKPVTVPVILNVDTLQGAELDRDQVIAAWPTPLSIPNGLRVFAMGRLGDQLFVRFRSETKGLLNTSDEVLVLGPGGVAVGTGQLAFGQREEGGGRIETAVVEAGGRATRTSVSVDAVGTAKATLVFQRLGSIAPDGAVTFGSLHYADLQGTFTNPATNEKLLFAMDGATQRAFFEGPGTPRVALKVEGNFGGLELVLRKKDGKARPLKVGGARRSIVWTQPDGTQQRFIRFANPPSASFFALFPPLTGPFTLDARTPKGPMVTAAVLDGVWPEDRNFGSDERSYAMGRLNQMLFLRTQRGTHLTDEVLVLGKDGRVRTVQHLQSAGDDGQDTTESLAIIGAEGGITVEAKTAMRLTEHYKDPLTEGLVAHVELAQSGRIAPTGELTWRSEGMLSVDGDYVCLESREYLVLVTVDGKLRALHAAVPGAKLTPLEVTGKPTDATLTVRGPDGGTQVLTVDDRRLGVTWAGRKFIRNFGM